MESSTDSELQTAFSRPVRSIEQSLSDNLISSASFKSVNRTGGKYASSYKNEYRYLLKRMRFLREFMIKSNAMEANTNAFNERSQLLNVDSRSMNSGFTGESADVLKQPHRVTRSNSDSSYVREQQLISDETQVISDNSLEDFNNQTAVISTVAAPCVHPEYLVFTWVMCLVALATTLKLYFLIKTLLAFFMVTFYALLVIIGYPSIFIEYPESK